MVVFETMSHFSKFVVIVVCQLSIKFIKSILILKMIQLEHPYQNVVPKTMICLIFNFHKLIVCIYVVFIFRLV